MKKLLFILTGFLSITAFGQQFPFMEGYITNPYSLSSAYAGLKTTKTIFADYRADWAGLENGPETYQLTYNDRFGKKVGAGVKFVYDKTDIFKQIIFLATYAYDVQIKDDHNLNLALSAGIYKNSIDLSKYYNNPEYIQDIVLLYGTSESKIKFATDISTLYHFKQLEAGILFSNIMFGTAKYKNNEMTYKPFNNYQLHAAYDFKLDEKWSLKPMLLFKGGQNVPSQFEVVGSVIWNKRIWGTLLYRTGGVIGGAFGADIYKGMIISYSYNMSTSVAINTFGSHQLTLGVKIIQPKTK